MRSIDSLREYAANAPDASMSPIAKAIVAGLADSIEREVEELRDREYRNGREDAGGAAEFADRLCRASERREDVTLWGVDYMPYPLDADGVPIHVGEKVQIIGNDPSTVSHMSLADDGWRVYVKYDGDLGTGSGQPSRIRHHRAPTVEDVLREFVERLDEIGSEDDCAGVDEQECRACIRRDIAAAYAEYAARLMLAGEGE